MATQTLDPLNPPGSDPEASRPKRPSVIDLPFTVRTRFYAARAFLDREDQARIGLQIPFDVYFQDPFVAEKYPDLGFDGGFLVPWEPRLADGPTSARFAVVDYNGDTGTLTPPARWSEDLDTFVGPDGQRLDRDQVNLPQFHQVSAWAIAQRALDFFESGFGLGRRIPWAFEGNRLVIVPHAGYGENAYYDRQSKSLQFYYGEDGGKRLETCLSTDIVSHEFGHAVLDGIRPHFIEALEPQTAAFHEFVGDLTAILMAFRNNDLRKRLANATGGDLTKATAISDIAEQFGQVVSNRPYLRTARSPVTMAEVAGEQRPHRLSEVLTATVFDMMLDLVKHYAARPGSTPAGTFADTVQRMQIMAVQALDLLPPVDVTFRDYALAMLRAEDVANPTDPEGYRDLMLRAFTKRGILSVDDVQQLEQPHYVFERLDLEVFHDVDVVASSPAEAYRFLDDNRRKLFIPWNVDLRVVGVFTAQKLTREARRLPKQVLLQYLWREDVPLEGARFGQFAGQSASLPCGGTLALDQNGNVLAWTRKPGVLFAVEGKGNARKLAEQELADGRVRREGFLANLERRVRSGMIGDVPGGEGGILAPRMAPLTARTVNGALRFELCPHLGVHDDSNDVLGGRQWQISS